MNIIVTGASSGIGFETVKVLSLNSGNNIIAIARNEKNLKKLCEECSILNPSAKVYPIAFDLENNDFNTLRSLILRYFPQINILINNAGLLINKPFEQLNQEEVYRMFNVNFFSVFKLVQLLIPYFNISTTAHIVNVSSMGGFQGSSKFPGLSAYSASKASLINLTECLAEELREKSIYVNCLALGAVQTEMLAKAFPGYKAPLTPDIIASFIADFSLNGYRYFNGKILPVSLSVP